MLSFEENQAGLLTEFSRRMRHQLAMKRVHDEGCMQGVGCLTGRLISAGLADSWTTLTGIGYAREASEIMQEGERDDNANRGYN